MLRQRPTGGVFTYEEFVAFAGEVDGKRMWDEAAAIDDDIPSFGNWAGVVRDVHQKRVFPGVTSDYRVHGRALPGHIAMDGGDAMDELQIATRTATLLHLASVGYRQPENCPLVVLIMS